MIKKGNLSLSINSVVVLILAITMLGLGLGFMKKTFGGATKQFDQVSEEMKKEMADKMKGIDRPVDLDVYEIEVPNGKEKTVYLGIKNDGSDRKKFDVSFSSNCLGGGSVDVTMRSSIRVPGTDVGIIPIKVKGTGKGKCKVTFNVKEDGETTTYGSIILYVTVI